MVIKEKEVKIKISTDGLKIGSLNATWFVPLSQITGTTYLNSEDEWKIYSTNKEMSLTFMRCGSQEFFKSLVSCLEGKG